MKSKVHSYQSHLTWTGNQGEGTKSYRSYDRSYEINVGEKPSLQGSSDPHFMGDPSKYNPEELLVMALSGCHMLWYLHLCSVNHIVVETYEDAAQGIMQENPDGSGEFTGVVLSPRVKISSGDIDLAIELHKKAHHLCFIARSVNFSVKNEPEVSEA